MAINPREYVENDKRFPATLTGDAYKVLAINAAETAYEHVPVQALTGQIIMWPLDTPPDGFLICNGAAIPVEHTTLIALIGANTPNISFAKNSKGTNTGNLVAESVGTHGHTATAVAAHGHSLNINSVGGHQHLRYHCTGTGSDGGNAIRRQDQDCSSRTAGDTAGAHGHNGSIGAGGGHTPIIENHTGVNQPAHTLVNFCIRT